MKRLLPRCVQMEVHSINLLLRTDVENSLEVCERTSVKERFSPHLSMKFENKLSSC